MKVRIDKVDKLFSRYLRLRADGKCEYCGKYVGYEHLQISHFVGRRKNGTRYDESNCCILCFSCHNYFHEWPYYHTEFFKKRLGTEGLDQLILKGNRITKIDKEQIEAELKEKLKLCRKEV